MSELNPSGGGSGMIYPGTPPKDPILVLVLNLLVCGGAGYIILGQKMKGIIAIVIWVAVAIPTCGVVSLLLALAAAIDGYLQAQQLRLGHPIGRVDVLQRSSLIRKLKAES